MLHLMAMPEIPALIRLTALISAATTDFCFLYLHSGETVDVCFYNGCVGISFSGNILYFKRIVFILPVIYDVNAQQIQAAMSENICLKSRVLNELISNFW